MRAGALRVFCLLPLQLIIIHLDSDRVQWGEAAHKTLGFIDDETFQFQFPEVSSRILSHVFVYVFGFDRAVPKLWKSVFSFFPPYPQALWSKVPKFLKSRVKFGSGSESSKLVMSGFPGAAAFPVDHFEFLMLLCDCSC